jgi:maltose O-acetyltransferase
METMKDRMLKGKLYNSGGDQEIRDNFLKARELVSEYNALSIYQFEKKREILTQLLGSFGQNGYMEANIRFDYGSNTFIGDHFYSNYDLIVIDVAKVIIGNDVFFGPRVGLYTAWHPIVSSIRNELLEGGSPITIGNSCWFGGNVTVNPGVTIGNDTVIGSGSVVTHDIPSNCVAVGNPCHILRKIDDKDYDYWKKAADEYYSWKKDNDSGKKQI